MTYLISLGVGFAVGLLYWGLRVQSPAPPLIALIGLLGMVLGEHAIPTLQSQFFSKNPSVATSLTLQSEAEKSNAKPSDS